MTPTEKRLAKIVELGETVVFELAETAGSMTDAQMRDALQRLRSIGREVSRLPDKFKTAYKSSVPWEAMSEWADSQRFGEASFNRETLTGCCETLEVALPELSRHCGGHTSIQEKVARRPRPDVIRKGQRLGSISPGKSDSHSRHHPAALSEGDAGGGWMVLYLHRNWGILHSADPALACDEDERRTVRQDTSHICRC